MIHAVILAGGSGTRFWPLSRETFPKQMLNIVGEDSLLQQTIKRLDGFLPPDHLWIVTTEALAQVIGFHLKTFKEGTEKIQFIIEPFGRNTAPAVGLAAVTLHRISTDSIMIVMPSDHAIRDLKPFQERLLWAVEAARKGCLVTFGIRPSRPETGYGYIQCGPVLDSSEGRVFHAERFLEKPDLKTAEILIQKGNFYWNSGIFVWKVSKILQEIQTHLPSLYEGLKEIEGLNHLTGEAFNKIYTSLEAVSIDHGVLEKSQDVFVIPSDFGWSDVGSWTALDDMFGKDERGNILQGNPIDFGSESSIVIASDRVVATIGLKNMVVVDTPDATLIASKEKVQEVRRVVETLKKNRREEYLLHRTVERPWGHYTVLEKGSQYKIKRIMVHPGAKLSLQRHRHRSEHWVVVSGAARVTRGEELFDIHPNESTFIPMLVKHRLENTGSIPLQIIEVQNGDYVEEDDIERFDDVYGREINR